MPTVTITRAKLYRPPGQYRRFAWQWTYQYQIDDGVPISYGEHLASLRGMLRRKFRGEDLRVVETWKAPSVPEVPPATRPRVPRAQPATPRFADVSAAVAWWVQQAQAAAAPYRMTQCAISGRREMRFPDPAWGDDDVTILTFWPRDGKPPLVEVRRLATRTRMQAGDLRKAYRSGSARALLDQFERYAPGSGLTPPVCTPDCTGMQPS